MFNVENYSCILWDFDGVLMDSMPVRDDGFLKVLKKYPKEQVDLLMAFHQANGGLSRYVKFRYFFETIRKESISVEKVQELANEFSKVMLKSLHNPSLLIDDSVDFVKNNYNKIPMHIVSGSDGDELRFLCQQTKIDTYFKSIHGSPTSKKELVHNVLQYYKYNASKVVLIGDSINDYEAAQVNNVSFCGYNNKLLDNGGLYVNSFNSFKWNI